MKTEKKIEDIVEVWDADGHYADIRRIRRESVEQQIEPISMALKDAKKPGRKSMKTFHDYGVLAAREWDKKHPEAQK